MKKVRVKREDLDVQPGYMGTFADMFCLLMAFFVMLYSTTNPDPGKYEDLAEAMKEAFAAENTENEFKKLEEELNKVIKDTELESQVKVELGPNGIKIRISDSSLYSSGSAIVMDNMTPVIEKISKTITELLDESSYKDYVNEVKRYTDNNTILKENQNFNLNWELSAIRITGIIEI